MAEVSFKHVKKVYPNNEKKSRKKRGDAEKSTPANVTDEGVLVVRDFNLDIADREFIVLVGPSGCGKSTTLRMIAGLEDITDGEITIDGTVVNDVAPKDRDIAMVFQSYALYPHMTVYENMAFPLKLRKLPKDQIDAKVRESPSPTSTRSCATRCAPRSSSCARRSTPPSSTSRTTRPRP